MKGITSIEAKKKLDQFGYNELRSSKPKTIFNIAFEVVKEPMFVLLISCGLLYFILYNYRKVLFL